MLAEALMRIRAAGLHELGGPFKFGVVELDAPKEREVLVRLAASGLCHSDHHLLTGDVPVAPIANPVFRGR